MPVFINEIFITCIEIVYKTIILSLHCGTLIEGSIQANHAKTEGKFSVDSTQYICSEHHKKPYIIVLNEVCSS